VTPTVANEKPDHMKPWRFTWKNDAGEDCEEVNFKLDIPKAEAPVIEEGPEVLVPDFHDNRIGMTEYDLLD
jgi:hypothetical protein